MSNLVFIFDTNQRLLDPVHPGKAWRLLSAGNAAVFRRYPLSGISYRYCQPIHQRDAYAYAFAHTIGD
jgi:hypothetical protein